MKIEIRSEDLSLCDGHEIYLIDKNRFVNTGGFNGRYFSDDDIYYLLGGKKYAQFEGGKSVFNVTKFDLYMVTKDIDFYENNKAHLYK